MNAIQSENSLKFERFVPEYMRVFTDVVEFRFGGQMTDVGALLVLSKEAATEARALLDRALGAWPASEGQ